MSQMIQSFSLKWDNALVLRLYNSICKIQNFQSSVVWKQILKNKKFLKTYNWNFINNKSMKFCKLYRKEKEKESKKKETNKNQNIKETM